MTANDMVQPSAKRAKRNLVATRSHVASLIGMRSVTPRAIAYVAVQVCLNVLFNLDASLTTCHQLRFALSNANSWRIVDGEFSHEVFYAACIDYFEDVPGPVARARVDALLAWWNRFVIP